MKTVKNNKIAITGGLGTGKSSVLNIFKEFGFKTFNCDEYNSILLNENSTKELLKTDFKQAFVEDSIDKKILANIIYNNDNKRKKLNDIMHPLIINKLKELVNSNEQIICEVPLLYELFLNDLFDCVIVVYANIDNRIKRLIKKGYTTERINEIISKQIDIDKKIEIADKIIYNDNDLNDLYKQVKKIIMED